MNKRLLRRAQVACYAFSLLLVSLGVVLPAKSQRVIFYPDISYRGPETGLEAGSHDLTRERAGVLNDKVRSVKVPKGMVVVLYENAGVNGGFGRSVDLLEDCADLSAYQLNGKISFIKIFPAVRADNGVNQHWVRNSWENGVRPGQWANGCVTAEVNSIGVVVDPFVPEQRVASTPAMLHAILTSDFKGEVIIPRDVCLNMTDYANLPLKDSVSLIGERGTLNSRPCIINENISESVELFITDGNNIRVEGIHFIGPQKGERDERLPATVCIRVYSTHDLKKGKNIVIRDNEFNDWSGAAVGVRGLRHAELSAYPDSSKPNIKNHREILIERNYFHHNSLDEEGYGVNVDGGCYATIEANVFDFNRHAISAAGEAYSGYIARYNYCLTGGFTEGSRTDNYYYNQHFDVHGARPGGKGYGGIAGRYFEVTYNTFVGAQKYGYLFLQRRPALSLRGRVDSVAIFKWNVLAQPTIDAAIALKTNKNDPGIGENEGDFNYQGKNTENTLNTDYSREIANGDFDGDGLTDIFIANGTGWFYSRSGITHWEYLRESGRLTSQLAFADIDNDCITDVIWMNEHGNLGYFKSGRNDLLPVSTSPAPGLPVKINELRFGDFDGDSKTDMFYTYQRQWYIWYGKTKTWFPAQTSGSAVTELLFGEFDHIKGTDVAGVVEGKWKYSSAGGTTWIEMNDPLLSSFVVAVAADFDGDYKTDIAYSYGNDWWYSSAGRSPAKKLAEIGMSYYNLKSMLIGNYYSESRAQVVGFDKRSNGAIQYRFVIWLGLDNEGKSRGGIEIHSRQNMR